MKMPILRAGAYQWLLAGVFLTAMVQLFSVSAIAQGSLTPPGAPAPTMKSLDQVEPRTPIDATHTPGNSGSVFVINQPGSYYLTANLAGVANKFGISIQADDVTVDLNGFSVTGLGTSFSGIVGGGKNLCIRNGTVRGWGNDGVSLASATNSQLINVRASNNTFSGISAGSRCLVRDCVADANGQNGISAGGNDTIAACTAAANGGSGIAGGPGNVISDSIAYSNVSAGINVANANAIIACSASANGSAGIMIGGGSVVKNCTARENQGQGINGSDLGSGVTLISDCAVTFNSLDGILVTQKAIIHACSAHWNTGDGIDVGSDSLLTGNNCDGNGFNGDGAGIHATGSRNRIDANMVNSNDRGIEVDAAINMIVRNIASGNTTNWDVVAGNVILVVSATTAGAFTGSNGGTPPGSTDPNANFSY